MAEVEIPKQHKACVYDEPGKVSVKIEMVHYLTPLSSNVPGFNLVQVDTPEPGPGEVLVNLTHSGVCHSDMAIMLNGVRNLVQ